MKAWLSQTQIRQRPMLAVYGGLLVLVAGGIGVATLIWLNSASSDRLAVISNLLSLGTLLLALVAGIVALAAYSAATGLPDLTLSIDLPGNRYNEVSFFASEWSVGPWLPVTVLAGITVKNSSKYAARTPAVIIDFSRPGLWNSNIPHPKGGRLQHVIPAWGQSWRCNGTAERIMRYTETRSAASLSLTCEGSALTVTAR
jgi:hypothetical protein